MAIIQEGILGFAFGRVGPVTGYRRNGQNILRTSKNSGVVKSTNARIAQREKIKICNDFTGAFTGTGFFNKTFPAYGHAGSGYNRVTSCLMNLALTGTYPDQRLAWEKVLIARGALPLAENAAATKDIDENILFTWTDNSGVGTARYTDKVILVAYSPELKQIIFSLDAAQRGDENASLSATSFKHLTVVTWIAFINKEGDVSDSVFCGMVNL
ncbi:MAG: DUF6266 family protein [Ferruginibacter sp.]